MNGRVAISARNLSFCQLDYENERSSEIFVITGYPIVATRTSRSTRSATHILHSSSATRILLRVLA
eukprot:scaffold313277_cov17-Prasinocladus_malaysianus.AAC.1